MRTQRRPRGGRPARSQAVFFLPLIVITYQLPTNHPYFVIASRRRRRSNPHIGQEIASLRSQ